MKGADADLTEVNASIANLEAANVSKIFSEAGAHGFRYWNEKLSYDTGDGTWIDILLGTASAPTE